LVHELGHKGPHTTRELLDIAINFASSEEVVGAIFHDQRARRSGRRTSTRVGSGRNSKKKKNKQSHRDTLVAAAECKNP
jgi:hypothetical protein